MDPQIPAKTELIARIGWLIRLRWLAVLGTGAGVLFAWLLYPEALPLLPLLAVVAVIALYNTQFLFYARTLEMEHAGVDRLKRATGFAYVQIVADLLALSVLIHFSGGVESPLAVFYAFHTIIASILLSRRVSFLMATLAIVLFAVDSADRGLRLGVARHLDETEALAAAGVAIVDHFGTLDRAVLGEQLIEVAARRVKTQVATIQFLSHGSS